MKFVLLVLLVVGVFCVPVPSEEELEVQFSSFIAKYEKVYDSDAQRKARFEIFKENALKNAWKNTLGHATYGVNKFADLSEEEFRLKYLSPMPKGWKPAVVAADLPTNAIPTSFDWRPKGAVTHVKNQGQCGSCWSFSATGNIEGNFFLGQTTNPVLVSFSEQQFVDCDTVDQGCNGGLPSNAYEYAMKAGGLETEGAYPYTAMDGTCQFQKSNVVANIKNWTAISTNEDQIAAYLAANGPISIGINAMWMQTYTSGVSDPLYCPADELDHGVLIVGYGVETGVFENTPYWIIKNSWGTGWGEQGYYRIVRGKGACGLNTMCTSALGAYKV